MVDIMLGGVMRFDPTAELDDKIAHKIIRHTIESDRGTIILSNHAKLRMRERGYTSHDVEYILLNGRITKKEYSPKTRTWAYTIKGDDLEGDAGGVVTAIVHQWSSIVVTVLS
jgi:hypothetical protein